MQIEREWLVQLSLYIKCNKCEMLQVGIKRLHFSLFSIQLQNMPPNT